ncbi:hypothetical protein MTO96_020803 [Rhipicephalus appendiculatus]
MRRCSVKCKPPEGRTVTQCRTSATPRSLLGLGKGVACSWSLQRRSLMVRGRGAKQASLKPGSGNVGVIEDDEGEGTSTSSPPAEVGEEELPPEEDGNDEPATPETDPPVYF